MPVPTDHLAEEIKDQGVRLLARIDALDVDMRGQSADLKWIKRIGAFVATFLVLAVAGSGRIIWDASQISLQTKQQSGRLDQIDGRMEKTNGQLNGVEKRLDKIDGRLDGMEIRTGGVEKRLDGVEKRLDGIDGRLGGVEKRQERMGAQLDGIAKGLDVLIQRAGKP